MDDIPSFLQEIFLYVIYIRINCNIYDRNKDVLSKEELAVLNRIYNKFVSFGSADISNYSHKEKGYMETQKGEIISYAYAKYIELN